MLPERTVQSQSGRDELHDEITHPGSLLSLGQRVEDAAPFGHAFCSRFAQIAIAKQTLQLAIICGVLKGLGNSAQVILSENGRATDAGI